MQSIKNHFWELKRVLSLPLGNAGFKHLENEWQINIYKRYGKTEFTARLFRGEFFNLVPTNQLPVPEAPYDTIEFVFVEEVGLFEAIRARSEKEAVAKALSTFVAKFANVLAKNSVPKPRNLVPKAKVKKRGT